MKKKPTQKDIQMLTAVRDRLLGELRRNNPPRREHVPSGRPAPITECNHGVPWTECTVCSKKKCKP